MRASFFISGLLAVCTIGNASAQENVGIGTTAPNPKALLDLTSTDKGFLLPRVSTQQRLAIAPAAGVDKALMVFDTDDNLFYYWDGNQWVGFPQPAGGNNISLTFDSATQILSITDQGGTLSALINISASDNDTDSSNELITGVVFNNNGKVLTIYEGGNTWATTINVEDDDADPTNEFNTAFTYNSSTHTLSITDGGNTLSVNLSSLNNIYTAGTGIGISGNVISNTGDLSATNELITSLTFNSNTNLLTITEGGSSHSANLSALANDWKLTGNANTNPALNFLGTSDPQDLVLRTNNIERIRITAANGYIGVGTNSPSALFHVFNTQGGTIDVASSTVGRFTHNTHSWELRVGAGNGWLCWLPNSNDSKRWQIRNSTGDVVFNVNVDAPVNSLFMAATGHLEIGSGAGTTRRINLPNIAANEGRGRAQDWETYSDGRIKSDVRALEYGLAEVMKMQPKSYFHHYSLFTEDGTIHIKQEKSRTIGFIAQEMYEIIPESVSKPMNEQSDLWSMSYDKLIPVLVKAIQEQQEIIERLQHEQRLIREELAKGKQILPVVSAK